MIKAVMKAGTLIALAAALAGCATERSQAMAPPQTAPASTP